MSARQGSSGTGSAGTDAAIDGGVTSAAWSEMKNAGADGVEPLSPDAAQQLSACDCVMTCPALVPDSGERCMGQEAVSAQQAMRACGVLCHPAHSAHPATQRVRARMSAAVRVS